MASWIANLVRGRVGRQTPPPEKPCVVTGCDGIMIFDDAEWPSYATWTCGQHADHRELLYGELRPPAPVKRCSFTGCDGIMTCNDAHWPFAVKWECDRGDVDHLELILSMKPCIVADCKGTMFWEPRSGLWTCNEEPTHRQLEPQPAPYVESGD
jgi:hypothetical protein